MDAGRARHHAADRAALPGRLPRFQRLSRASGGAAGPQARAGRRDPAREFPSRLTSSPEASPDDIANCTNRSPYPTLHLLREASIDRAVAGLSRGRGDLRGQHANAATARARGLGRAGRGAARHERRSTLELRPGQSIELLKELHILTREGRINQDSRRKLKQVYHLYQFIEKLLLELPAEPRPPDAGGPRRRQVLPRASSCTTCSSSTRGTGHIYGIETRAELVEKSRAAGRAAGVRAHVVPEPERGRGGRRRRTARSASTSSRRCTPATPRPTTRSPSACASRRASWCWCRAARRRWRLACARTRRCRCRARRWPSCGAIRCTRANWAASSPTCCAACTWRPCGYQVTVTELVGWEHSLKNELILARRTGQRKRSAARAPARPAGRVRAGEPGAGPLPAARSHWR